MFIFRSKERRKSYDIATKAATAAIITMNDLEETS